MSSNFVGSAFALNVIFDNVNSRSDGENNEIITVILLSFLNRSINIIKDCSRNKTPTGSGIVYLAKRFECSPMARETWVQSPGRVIPKTQKMVLDVSLLNTQHYKVRIKGKVEKPREGVAPSPTPWCSSYRKGSLRVTLDYGRQLYFTYLVIFLSLGDTISCTERIGILRLVNIYIYIITIMSRCQQGSP